MLEMTMTPKLVTCRVSANAPLPVLATAMLNSYSWMLSQGVWKFSVTREKLHKTRAESTREGDCLVKVAALVDPKPVTFSGVTDLGQLFDAKFAPNRASDTDYWMGRQTTGFYQREGETIFVQPDIRRDININYVCYGWADMDVGYFMRGVQSVKHLLSRHMAQTWYDMGFDQAEMLRMALKQEDYNASTPVKDLPGRFSPENN